MVPTPEPPAQPEMRRVSSTVVYANPWMTVREDTLVRPDGSSGIYGVVDKPDFAVVIAEQDDCFHLVEQFRFALDRRSWEFPQGGWPPGHDGGTPLELAVSELAEETGVRAATWRHIGRWHHAGGFCSQGFDLFHATDLTPGEHAREESESDMVHALIPTHEFRAMILDGRIIDAVTIAAYALLDLTRR